MKYENFENYRNCFTRSDLARRSFNVPPKRGTARGITRRLTSAPALFLAAALSAAFLLSGCGQEKAIDCPFTNLGWETGVDELFEAEGECTEPYDSTYGGQVYTYPDSYMGYDGTIKYMYDDKGVLMSVAFAYGSDSAEELKEFYDKLSADIEKKYGKCDYDTDSSTNYGQVWELDEGHIILSVMLTNSNKALQIAYVNPLNQK